MQPLHNSNPNRVQRDIAYYNCSTAHCIVLMATIIAVQCVCIYFSFHFGQT